MPGRDRSGPMGKGPMTGGGFGYCNPNSRADVAPGQRRGFFGLGSGRRAGGRRAWLRPGWSAGRWWPRFGLGDYAGQDPETEKQSLKQEIQALKAQLKDAEDRLSAMETSAEEH